MSFLLLETHSIQYSEAIAVLYYNIVPVPYVSKKDALQQLFSDFLKLNILSFTPMVP